MKIKKVRKIATETELERKYQEAIRQIWQIAKDGKGNRDFQAIRLTCEPFLGKGSQKKAPEGANKK